MAFENLNAEDVDWAQLFVGSIVAMSQVRPFKKRVNQLNIFCILTALVFDTRIPYSVHNWQ